MASKLSQIQARFQQKQMQEKEEKLLRLYESQQQRAIDRVNRGSAGSNTSATSINTQGGKVRQMFDERRQKAGIDRSYPLEPLRITKSNGYNGNSLDNTNTRIIVKQTVKKDSVQIRNGKPIVNKRETTHSIYNNNNGDESYEERTFTDSPSRPILNRTYKRRDLEMMMREHSRNANIDDEEFPDVNIEEFEEPSPKPKLNNIRRSYLEDDSISQTRTPSKTIVRNISSDKSGNSPKRETKPLVKKSSSKTVRSSPSKEIVTSKTFTPPSPARSTTKTTPPAMSSKSSQKPGDFRTPSTQRPSSLQSSRVPSTVIRDDLQLCKYCNRRFQEDRLAVHEDICAKTQKKKRKTYDATKHRVQGTELEPFARKINKPVTQKCSNSTTISNSKTRSLNGQPSKTTPKKYDWRKKHEEFISAIRAAKVAQAHVAKGGKLSDLPPPPPSENPDYVQCPHCGRKFNESAAERHIPKCKTYNFNKPKAGARAGRK